MGVRQEALRGTTPRSATRQDHLLGVPSLTRGYSQGEARSCACHKELQSYESIERSDECALMCSDHSVLDVILLISTRREKKKVHWK